MVLMPSAPSYSDDVWVETKLSMAPPFHEACSAGHEWSRSWVHSAICVLVFMWNGRSVDCEPPGQAWVNAPRLLASSKPTTPAMVPK